MMRTLNGMACLMGAVAAAVCMAGAPALAQQAGGTLRAQLFGNPPSLSIHEESTVATIFPMMPVMSNLVVYDQHEPQNSLETIRPDLAESWSWNDDNTAVTFKLRQGVKWHDGAPFTAADVKCTWDMLQGKSEARKLRRNPREIWYHNLKEVKVEDDFTVTFELGRPQPAFLALLASGQSPVYACHVPPADMRTKPIGTGPFKLVTYRQNERLVLEKNPDYFKKGLPYLDGIAYQIISSRSTRHLAFIAGEHDITFPTDVTVPTLKDLKAQAPNAQCTQRLNNNASNILVNQEAPPFDNPDLRRALALTLDRDAFNEIINEGQGGIGGAMLPPPSGQWGLPDEILKQIPGYGGDVEKNRDDARAIMEKLGYTENSPLKIKVITRNIASYRDPAVIFIDQLSKINIQAELEIIDSAVYYSTITAKRFTVAMNMTGSAVDDPDQHFYENYACNSIRNYNGYCNKELETLFDRQSMEPDQQKRREIVWQIDRKLQEEVARPTLYHPVGIGCWHPQVQNYTVQINSIYNGWRFEDLWLKR
ncbi:peptide/nickel transport system substrate-binding protein [Constrictibacter sp. MBR-5]|uniref:ABC transporter substrate-binding protein n=1 Tax=Constrictibacter sp. MBR-5 TaxID=3156467 RepID=UPI003390E959